MYNTRICSREVNIHSNRVGKWGGGDGCGDECGDGYRDGVEMGVGVEGGWVLLTHSELIMIMNVPAPKSCCVTMVSRELLLQTCFEYYKETKILTWKDVSKPILHSVERQLCNFMGSHGICSQRLKGK